MKGSMNESQGTWLYSLALQSLSINDDLEFRVSRPNAMRMKFKVGDFFELTVFASDG